MLELTLSQGFISVFEDMRLEILGRQDEARLRALRFDSMGYLSAPLRPQLLENRYNSSDHGRGDPAPDGRSFSNQRSLPQCTDSVASRSANTLDNRDTQRYLRLWNETDRMIFAGCWPTGTAARLKVREILPQRRSKRLQ